MSSSRSKDYAGPVGRNLVARVLLTFLEMYNAETSLVVNAS